MNMPKRMQAYKLRDEFNKMGIAADLVDLEALIDSTLSYPENYRNIIGQYKRADNKAKKSKTKASGYSDIDLSYASQSHQARSLRSRMIDEARTSCKTFTENQLRKDISLLQKWYKNPNKFDIEGIDSFVRSSSCKRRRKR